jgi:carbon storage regulator CsrA
VVFRKANSVTQPSFKEETQVLILSRKQLEAIDCYTLNGEVVSVIVTRIGPNSVRLGIVAPDSVTVLRREVPFTPETREGDAA